MPDKNSFPKLHTSHTYHVC